MFCIYILATGFQTFFFLLLLFLKSKLKVKAKLFKLRLLQIYLKFPELLTETKLTVADFIYQVNAKPIFVILGKEN